MVFLKGGRSREGLESALSHTGSVSTSHDVVRTALRQFGVIEVDRSDELLPVGGALALQGHISSGYALRFSAELAGAELQAAHGIVDVVRRSGKLVVVHSMYADAASPPLDVLRAGGLPVLRSLDVACRAIRAMAERGLHLAEAGGPGDGASRPATGQPPAPPDRGTGSASNASGKPEGEELHGEDPVACARREGRTILLQPEVRALLAQRGGNVVTGWTCHSPEEASSTS